jgi:NTP pyrophosphatase (non-canonical NTP hydrolase)
MNTNLETLVANVELWAKERNLLSRETAITQFVKTVEELGELASALLKRDEKKIIDGIGDATVCLIILAKQLDFSFAYCLQEAYTEIKDRRGETKDGTFIKEQISL